MVNSMELWIRSQDKKILEKYEDLFSAYYSSKKSYAICSHKNMVTLGLYKTEKRTLEILDEIQNMIKPTLINTEYHSEIKEGVDKSSFDIVMTPNEDKITYIQPNVVVYEMPKE